MKPAVVFSVLAMLIAGAAFGEMIIVDSVEWRTIDSELIVKGTVAAIARVPEHDSFRDVTIAVDDTLKGKIVGKTVTIRVSALDNPQVWKKNGRTYLFFLLKGTKPSDGNLFAGHWVLRRHNQCIIDLVEPKHVYNGDGVVAKDSEEILRIVANYATRERPRVPTAPADDACRQSGCFWMPMRALTGVIGGPCQFVTVPAEEKYRAVAMKLATSGEPSDRWKGASMLGYYPGPETVKVLLNLLKDTHEAETFQNLGELVGISYPVREAAYSSLVALGVEADKPVLEREPTDKEKQAYLDDRWGHSMKAVLPEGWRFVSVSLVETPGGDWKRTAGGDGVAVVCRNPKKDIDTGPKPRIGQAARLTLYVMPRDWEGQDARNGGTIDDGKYMRTRGSLMVHQSNAVPYLGRNGQGFFFCTAYGLDPRPSFTRYFGLTVDETKDNDTEVADGDSGSGG